MTIGYCDPDDAPVQQWGVTGCTNHEDCVDDAVRQPANPSTSTRIIASVEEQSAIDQFTMDNSITNISEATQIIFWANARTSNVLSKDFYMDVYIAGSWVGYSTKSLTTSQAWYSKTVNGSWSQAQIDALQVRVRSDSSIGQFHLQFCYEVYCEVIYTEPTAGYKDVSLKTSLDSLDYKDITLKTSLSAAPILAYKDITLKTSLESALTYKDITLKTTLESVLTYKDITLKISFSAAPIAGYGHKVNGVSPANIAKINGVATANINKVNGV